MDAVVGSVDAGACDSLHVHFDPNSLESHVGVSVGSGTMFRAHGYPGLFKEHDTIPSAESYASRRHGQW